MKIALSVWKDSISTVFDAADQLMIVDPASDKPMSRRTYHFLASDRINRAVEMKEQGIDVLICGAISRPMETSIVSQGIKLYPFVRGTVDEIVNAYRENRLNQAMFFLPGCRRAGAGNQCGQRRRNCRREQQMGNHRTGA
jgi:predicted Fe-Mo cluster-binding NifX family protein